jgi:hypothetical protein
MCPFILRAIIELVFAVLMLAGIIFIAIHRILTKKGIGARAIQFAAVTLVVPGIFILALERALPSETVAALLGALTGYLLSGLGRFRPSRRTKASESKEGVG